MLSQRIMLDDLGNLPTLRRNMAVWSGTQHSVKMDAMVRQMIISRTDMALGADDDDDDDDGVTEEELFAPGVT